MRLSIHKETPARLPSTRLMRLFKMVADAEAPRNEGNENLVFAADAIIRRLNRQFRGIDRTTDVLSFHLDEPDDTDDTDDTTHCKPRRFADARNLSDYE